MRGRLSDDECIASLSAAGKARLPFPTVDGVRTLRPWSYAGSEC